MSNSIKMYLNNSYYYRLAASKVHKIIVLFNPKFEANRAYKKFFKRKINWKNPKNLIEKIFWLQFNSDTKLWTLLTDKYLVREYVSKCGYKNYLPKLYGKWDNSKEIDFEKLPNSFILKTNNGCGTVLIVKDKKTVDINSISNTLNKWLNIPFGYRGAQLHYTKIKPCIIAEELLINSKEDQLLSPKSLIDYKVYCLNGEPEVIWVSYDRTKKGVSMTLYDLDWEKLPQNLISSDFYSYSDRDIPKPKCLQEILDMSRKLSNSFPQVRVDFYIINNRPVFGELTFTTGWSFFTHEFYEYLGDKIDLTKINKLY